MNEEDYLRAEMQNKNQILNSQIARDHTEQLRLAKALEHEERGLAEAQIDLREDLKLLENVLRCRVEVVKDGETIWEDPKDPMQVPLSDEGVKFLINTLRFYTSKNHLLSAYDEDTILAKCEDIGIAIADELFMRSETYFNIPTVDKCKQILKNNLEKKKESIINGLKLQGKSYDEDKIWEYVLGEVDVDRELEIMHKKLSNDIYKTYILMVQKCLDFIHSTYNRALHGQERKTLRQHHTISESRNPYQPTIPQDNRGGIFSWFKK